MVFFETVNLISDELTLNDTERFHEICNQPFILNWMKDWEMDLKAVKGLLDFFIKGYEIKNPEKQPFVMAVRLKEENRLIGICGYGPKDELGGKAEICYFIDKDYSNNGYMGQIIPKAIEYYFDMTQNEFLSALVDEHNIPSKKLLLTNGFSYFKVNDSASVLESHYRHYRRN